MPSNPATRGGDNRHLLAEARAERAVVGLDLDLAELVGVGDEAQLAHVELVAHDLGHAQDRLALGRGGDHDGGLQRLAQLDLRLRARREAQCHGLAGDRHRLLERGVAPPAAVGQSARCTESQEPSRFSKISSAMNGV